MKKVIILAILMFPLITKAGLLGFLGDVASISSAMSSGSVSQGDLKDINKYLWRRVEQKQKLEGYKSLVEALEKSNKAGYLDTVARTYYINGEKDKAIELYETRVLPTARATCRGCEAFYKSIVGLESSQPIPYEEIYKKNKKRQKDLEEASHIEQETSTVEYAIWGIFLIMLLNLYANRKHFFESIKS